MINGRLDKRVLHRKQTRSHQKRIYMVRGLPPFGNGPDDERLSPARITR